MKKNRQSERPVWNHREKSGVLDGLPSVLFIL